MMPRTVSELMVSIASVVILLARRKADASPSRLIMRLKTVMNAVESAPSANRSRSRFGMRNAMVKASSSKAPPNSAAKTCSRANPNRRLHITARPTMPAARVFRVSGRERTGAGADGVSEMGVDAKRETSPASA